MVAWVDFPLAAFPTTFVKDLQLCIQKKIVLCGLMSIVVL